MIDNFNTEPSLLFLIIKLIVFLIVTYWTGWGISDKKIFLNSRISDWVLKQVIGASALLIISFSFVSFNIHVKFLVIFPFIIILIRLGYNFFWKLQPTYYLNTADNLYKSLSYYIFGTLIISSIYLTPFIYNFTSGLYAYGGGDHSSYFRISDLVINQSLKELMSSMGITYHNSGNCNNTNVLDAFPPSANWGANNFAIYLACHGMYTFANQTIGSPFIALGLINSEESWTAGLTLYLILLCFSASIFVLNLFKKSNSSALIFVGAIAGVIASPALSLVLKQTIPAVFSFGTMLILTSLLCYWHNIGEKNFKYPLIFGLGLSSSYLMYLPAILPFGFLWLYLFLKNFKTSGKNQILWGLIVFLTLVICLNKEYWRPIMLALVNVSSASVDFRLVIYDLFPTTLGFIDYETLINLKSKTFKLALFTSVIFTPLFFIFIKKYNKNNLVLGLFLLPILILIINYWFKDAHYHLIRLGEFVGVILIPIFLITLVICLNEAIKLKKSILKKVKVFSFIFCLLIFFGNALNLKYLINKNIFDYHNTRGDIIQAKHIKIKNFIENELNFLKKSSILYYMGWGSVPFANREILFRNVKYVESIEYDYSWYQTFLNNKNKNNFYNFDLLKKHNLKNALLLYPPKTYDDILNIENKEFIKHKDKIINFPIQRTSYGSGAALIGTGWLPPSLEGSSVVRYIRNNLDAALVIWTDRASNISVNIKAKSTSSNGFIEISKDNKNELLLQKAFNLKKNIFRKKDESKNSFINRIPKNILSVMEKYEKETLKELSLIPEENIEKFNNLLMQNSTYGEAVIHHLETKNDVFTNDLKKINQETSLIISRVNYFHDKNFTDLNLKIKLKKGINVFKLIPRDKNLNRNGGVKSKDLIYNGNAQMLVISEIKIL